MALSIDISDSYLQKVAKLIPSEILSALLAVNGLVPESNPDRIFWLEMFLALLIVINVFYMWKVRSVKDWKHVLFSSVALFLYACSIPYGVLSDSMWIPRFVYPVIAVVVNLLVPVFVKGEVVVNE